MKLVTILATMIFALSTTAFVHAQGRGNGQAKKTTVSSPKAKSTPKPAKAAKTAAKAEARAVKAETRAAKTTAKAEARATKAETKAARKSDATTTTTQTAKNPNQEARLLALLPPGTNIQDASQGFKNRGQFIAAVNASNNHNIPFADLKARMTGIAPGSTVPTTTPMSLGQAIQSFKGTTAAPQL